MFDRRDAADTATDLLERERQAILDARFDVLERIAAEKERLTRDLAKRGTDKSRVSKLRKMAAHNACLLEAMRSGIQNAMVRIGKLDRGPTELRTYDASGHRTTIGSGPRLKENW